MGIVCFVLFFRKGNIFYKLYIFIWKRDYPVDKWKKKKKKIFEDQYIILKW